MAADRGGPAGGGRVHRRGAGHGVQPLRVRAGERADAGGAAGPAGGAEGAGPGEDDLRCVALHEAGRIARRSRSATSAPATSVPAPGADRRSPARSGGVIGRARPPTSCGPGRRPRTSPARWWRRSRTSRPRPVRRRETRRAPNGRSSRTTAGGRRAAGCGPGRAAAPGAAGRAGWRPGVRELEETRYQFVRRSCSTRGHRAASSGWRRRTRTTSAGPTLDAGPGPARVAPSRGRGTGSSAAEDSLLPTGVVAPLPVLPVSAAAVLRRRRRAGAGVGDRARAPAVRAGTGRVPPGRRPPAPRRDASWTRCAPGGRRRPVDGRRGRGCAAAAESRGGSAAAARPATPRRPARLDAAGTRVRSRRSDDAAVRPRGRAGRPEPDSAAPAATRPDGGGRHDRRRPGPAGGAGPRPGGRRRDPRRLARPVRPVGAAATRRPDESTDRRRPWSPRPARAIRTGRWSGRVAAGPSAGRLRRPPSTPRPTGRGCSYRAGDRRRRRRTGPPYGDRAYDARAPSACDELTVTAMRGDRASACSASGSTAVTGAQVRADSSEPGQPAGAWRGSGRGAGG